MNNQLIAKVSLIIDVPVSKVWEALLNPELIKQYMFGTTVVSDWKEGSQIIWKGDWQGKPYEDKGVILKIVPEYLLVLTHFSPLSGVADIPSNYHTVSYELKPNIDSTQITLTQDNNASEDEAKSSEKNWEFVLQGLKKLLENN